MVEEVTRSITTVVVVVEAIARTPIPIQTAEATKEEEEEEEQVDMDTTITIIIPLRQTLDMQLLQRTVLLHCRMLPYPKINSVRGIRHNSPVRILLLMHMLLNSSKACTHSNSNSSGELDGNSK